MMNALTAIIAVVLARTDGSAALVAVIVIEFPLRLAGAVNNPVLEIVPALADHVTAVLLVLLTTAPNWTFPPAVIGGSCGVTWTLMAALVEEEEIVMEYTRSVGRPRAPSTTVIVKVKVPALVGTPEMLPVCRFNISPGGNSPWLRAKREGAPAPEGPESAAL